jgi:hypothetical protein
MIAVTPTTGPLGPPPGAVMPDAHRHHVVDAQPPRATWPLAGAVAAVASLVAASAGMASIAEEQYLDGVAVVDELERGGYYVSFLVGMIGVAALFITAAGWRRWAAHHAADDIAAGTIATALQATATVNIIGYSLAGALALYLPGGTDGGTMSDESLFVNFAYLDFGTLFGWWGAVLAAGCVAVLAFRGVLPRWMGIVSVVTMAVPLGFAAFTALPGMPGFVMPLWLLAISVGMYLSRTAGAPVGVPR